MGIPDSILVREKGSLPTHQRGLICPDFRLCWFQRIRVAIPLLRSTLLDSSTFLSRSTRSRIPSFSTACVSGGHAYLPRHQAAGVDSAACVARTGARDSGIARTARDLLSTPPESDRARACGLQGAATALRGLPAAAGVQLLSNRGPRSKSVIGTRARVFLCHRNDRLTQAAPESCQAQSDRHHRAALYNSLADLLHEVGQSDQAMEHLKQAVVFFAEVGEESSALQPEIWNLVEMLTDAD